MFKLFRSKFFIALGLLFLLLTTGVFGYRFIADYTWLDALYMTIITITTVGFGEVLPMGPTTKLFTVMLIVCSIFISAFAISVITEYIVTKGTFQKIKYKKMMKKINHLENHVIICGYGRNGKQAAAKLAAYKKPYVIIEKNKELVERFQDDVLIMEGNANEDEVLLLAGIKKAKCLITALPNDADNLFVVLSARQINEKLQIISRASEESSLSKLKRAGADNMIMPDKIGGDHMASLVVQPDLIEFMDQLEVDGEDSINVEEVAIEDIPKEYPCSTLIDLNLRKNTGCTVIGYKKPDGTYVVNPEGDLVLDPNSKLIVLGRPEQIKKLNTLFKLDENYI